MLVLGAVSCQKPPTRDMASVEAWVRSEFPDVEQVSTDELEKELESDRDHAPLLLDVRGEDEYRVSHIPGAIRVEPGGDLPDSLRSLARDTPIVAYCSVGYRSSQLVERLKKEGFTHAKNLEGSIFEWANKDYPLERDGKPVHEVHPYDETWGRLLNPALRSYQPRDPP
jgi:rhodanese-related sulfurtransferase